MSRETGILRCFISGNSNGTVTIFRRPSRWCFTRGHRAKQFSANLLLVIVSVPVQIRTGGPERRIAFGQLMWDFVNKLPQSVDRQIECENPRKRRV